MRFLYLLATPLCLASAKKDGFGFPSFDVSIGNTNANNIANIQDRRLFGSYDSGWKAKGVNNGDGFSMSKNGHKKAGYRVTNDDDSAIVWEYDTSASFHFGNATWNPTDTTVDKPEIDLEFWISATFPNATSLSKHKKKQSTTDIWDSGSYTPVPWQDVSVQVTQDSCPGDQNFSITAVDAEGNSVASATGINDAALTIPADAKYPVTVDISSDVGSLTSVLTDTTVPIKFAIGDGDNAPTQTFQYNFAVDFCPYDVEN